MTLVKPVTPDSRATRLAEQPTKPGRQDGEADVVDVPQADGDSAVKPAEAVQPAEKPARPVDNRANGWRGR